MSREKRMQMKKIAGINARISPKWKKFKARKEQMLIHTFSFHIDDVGTGWEYIHFELDRKTIAAFRISYIGPGIRSFVEEVTDMKEDETKEIVFYDEPGEHSLIFSRKEEDIYIEIPAGTNGFFMDYGLFRNQILNEYREKVG